MATPGVEMRSDGAGGPFAVGDVLLAGGYQYQGRFPVGKCADHARRRLFSLLSR